MSACAVISIIFVLRNTSRTIHTRVTRARSLIFQQIIRNTNYQLLFIVYCFVCHKVYKAKKSNYFNSHGEEAQEKPPGL